LQAVEVVAQMAAAVAEAQADFVVQQTSALALE